MDISKPGPLGNPNLTDEVFEFYSSIPADDDQVEVAGGDVVRFRLELEDGQLRSIGDGNYGMVFAAVDSKASPTGSATDKYAMKALYKHGVPEGDTEADIATRQRIYQELRLRQTIGEAISTTQQHWFNELEGLRGADGADAEEEYRAYSKFANNSGPNHRGSYLVLPEASLSLFEFPTKYFTKDQTVEFSTFAYLMTRYRLSLKDLLEGKAPADMEVAGDTKRSIEARSDEPSGYELLKRSNLRTRSAEALRVGRSLGRALQVLHSAGYRHQDIKPGNIYCEADYEHRFFRLGDLGFLESTGGADDIQTTVKGLEAQAAGSFNYRSVEQREPHDVAECAVAWRGGEVVLLSADPKFRETRIGSGDFAYFAKDSRQSLWTVASIEHEDDLSEIRLTHPGNDEKNPPETIDKTQIGFIKRTSVRTDLFGLGAIMFDILTAGKSPERFYEKLRPYDVEGLSLSAVAEQMPSWRYGNSADQLAASLFSALHDDKVGRELIPLDVAELIFKLMASSADDSYFNVYDFEGSEDPGSHWKAARGWHFVLRDIEAAIDAVEAKLGDDSANSYILQWDEGAMPQRVPAASQDSQRNEVPIGELLEKVASDRDAHSRWSRAALLVKLLSSTIEKDNLNLSSTFEKENLNHGDPNSRLWPQIVPASFEGVELSDDVFRFTLASKSLADIDKDGLPDLLALGDPLMLRAKERSNASSPFWWQREACDVQISVDSKAETFREGKTISFVVNYEPFADVRLRVEAGDFLVSSVGGSRATVLEALLVNDGRPVTDADSPGLSADSCMAKVWSAGGERRGGAHLLVKQPRADGEERRGEPYRLVKRPRAVEYYGGVLANYLYRSVFGRSEVDVDLEAGGTSPYPNADVPMDLFDFARRRPLDLILPSDATNRRKNLRPNSLKPEPEPERRFRFRTPRQPHAVETVRVERPEDKEAQLLGAEWKELKTHTFELLSWLYLGGFVGYDTEDQQWSKIAYEVEEWSKAVWGFWRGEGLAEPRSNVSSSWGDQPYRTKLDRVELQLEPSEWDEVLRAYAETARHIENQALQLYRKETFDPRRQPVAESDSSQSPKPTPATRTESLKKEGGSPSGLEPSESDTVDIGEALTKPDVGDIPNNEDYTLGEEHHFGGSDTPTKKLGDDD